MIQTRFKVLRSTMSENRPKGIMVLTFCFRLEELGREVFYSVTLQHPDPRAVRIGHQRMSMVLMACGVYDMIRDSDEINGVVFTASIDGDRVCNFIPAPDRRLKCKRTLWERIIGWLWP